MGEVQRVSAHPLASPRDPKDIQAGVGIAITTLFERLPAAFNTLYECSIGNGTNTQRQSAKDMIDTGMKLGDKLEASAVKINPITEAIVRSVRMLGEDAQRETYEKIQRALRLQIGGMSLDEISVIEEQCAARRAVLTGQALAG